MYRLLYGLLCILPKLSRHDSACEFNRPDYLLLLANPAGRRECGR